MQAYTIGFSNLDEHNPFTVAVRRNLEKVVAACDEVNLIVRDNALDTPRAIRNSEEFAAIPVDLAIVFHIDERAGMEVTRPLREKGIPIVSVDIPILMTTFFGINAQQAGEVAGDALADWVQANWAGAVDKVLVMTEYRAPGVIQDRFKHALATIKARLSCEDNDLLQLDNGGTAEVTEQRVRQLMETGWQDYHHIVILCQNDKIAAGALAAARDLDREQDIAVISYDGTEVAMREFQRPGSRLIVSPSFRPEQYGEKLLQLALRLIRKESVPLRNYVDPVCLTRDNFRQYLQR